MRFDATLTVRCNQESLYDFKTHCSENLGRDYQSMVREMMTALNEGRLHIVRTKNQKEAIGELYVDRK